MLNFTMQQTVKILTGKGSVSQIGELMKEEGKKKALLVCDKGTISAGIVNKVTDVLDAEDLEYVLFDEVIPDPPVEVVKKGAKVCEDEDCDFVIGLGGGSSIDTGKAINVTRFNKGDITRFAVMGTPMNESKGFVAIPTTAGTGSEVSDGIILTDTENDLKFAILAPDAAPEFAIVDPELMRTMPDFLTASTGLDVLAHSVECYTSNLANAYSDLICEKNIETVVKYLPRAFANGDDMEAREKMGAAATLGGWMLINVHAHLGHAMAHAIGGKLHVPHGVACAWTLPYAIEHVADLIPEKSKKLIELLGGELTGNEKDEELGGILKGLLIDFRTKLDVVPKKPDGADAHLEEVAKEAVAEVHQNFAHRKMDEEEVLKTLDKIFQEGA